MKQLTCRNLSIPSFLLCYLLRWLFFFFPSQMSYIIYPDGAAIHFLISRTLSILSFLLCYLLHWHFFFLSISKVLYRLSWWFCRKFYYLQDLIHSVFSMLLSFRIDSYFVLPIYCTLSLIFWRRCIIFSHFQDLIHSIFSFVVFYIDSSFFFPSQMSYII